MEGKIQEKSEIIELSGWNMFASKSPTKWEMLLSELSLKEGIAPIWDLAIFIETNKNNTLSTQEVALLEVKLQEALKFLETQEVFSEKDKNKIYNEFSKKIKTFKNRLATAINQEFCRFLKERRLGLGFSLKDIEDITGISSSHLHRIENSKRKPSIRVIEKLSKVLDIPQAEFLKNMNISIEKVDLLTLIEDKQFVVNGKELSANQTRLLKTYLKQL